MFKIVSIKTKVILFILISMLIVGIIANYLITELITKHFMDARKSELSSVSKIKKDQIDEYFKRIVINMQILSLDETLKSFIKDLKVEYEFLEPSKKEKFPYKDCNVERVYQKYQNYFQRYISKYGYYDFFIIEPKTSHIIYTVLKEDDLGENLEYGRLKTSGIAQAYKKALKYKRASFVDISLYSPSKNEPAMFIASPIFKEREIIAVIAFQISDRDIVNIMSERDGFGKIGETYLVGRDYLLRSNSFKDPINYSIKSSFKNPNTINIKTTSVQKAFIGLSGSEVIESYFKQKVLSSYDLISIDDFEWAIIAEMDIEEVLKANSNIRIWVTIFVLIFSILISIISFFFD